jgi:hypothetical protein
MYKLVMITLLGLVITACSINEPRLSFGKKCTVKENKVVYSYIWLYDKQVGIPADVEACKQIK